MTGYTKLFGSIVASTIWREDNETRILWITMLAMANKFGVVEAAIPGLADFARLTVAQTEASLGKLLAPDAYSRTKAHEGRRIEAVEGGWIILNHALYRARMSIDDRREYMKQLMRRKRANPVSNSVSKRYQKLAVLAQAEADSEAEPQTKAKTERDGAARPSRAAILSMAAKVLNTWNAQVVLPRCLVVSDKRRQSLEARLSEPFFAGNWEAALLKIQASRFCRGESDRGWKADFDWFIKPDVCIKIMEGKYDNGTSTRTGNNRGTVPENPRNACVTKGPTDYAAVFKRKAEEREKARMAQQILEAEDSSPGTGGA